MPFRGTLEVQSANSTKTKILVTVTSAYRYYCGVNDYEWERGNNGYN
jgi:hypothetical protein